MRVLPSKWDLTREELIESSRLKSNTQAKQTLRDLPNPNFSPSPPYIVRAGLCISLCSILHKIRNCNHATPQLAGWVANKLALSFPPLKHLVPKPALSYPECVNCLVCLRWIHHSLHKVVGRLYYYKNPHHTSKSTSEQVI